jgi:predicted AAA+ superfamily ATPase
MERTLISYLLTWLSSKDRKPLVLRGARQVGKTWIVRQLAHLTHRRCIEINFEKNPSHASLFESNNPTHILLHLSTLNQHQIDPKKTLLFLDEIQAAPELLTKLRWFAEECPDLPVIAAGSLLEFVLNDHSFSMPVGRISYAYLEPLSFEEFLLARDQKGLHDYLSTYHTGTPIPLALHEHYTL